MTKPLKAKKQTVETSVVLLSYNGKELLKTCLPSVLDQTYKDYEVILVDNGSTDGTMDWLEKNFPKTKYPRLRVEYLTPNRGFTGGNNYGVHFAKGKYIVLLSNDSVAHKDWLENLILGMKKSNVDIGCSVNLNGGFEKEIKRLVDKEHRSHTMNIVGENVLVSIPKDEFKSGVFSTFYAVGNSLCYKKGVCKEPFDQIYFIYAEDIYMCWRARLTGAKVGVVVNSRLNHGFSMSKKANVAAKNVASFNGTKNQLLNFTLFYSWFNILRILPLFLITQVAHVANSPRSIKVKCKAYWWYIKNICTIMKKRKALQSSRTVKDKELIKEMSYKFFDDTMFKFSKFSTFMISVMNKIFYVYCLVFFIRTKEFKK